jgi:hypothetical protein
MKNTKLKHRNNDCMLTLRLDRTTFNGITKKTNSMACTRSELIRQLIKSLLDIS